MFHTLNLFNYDVTHKCLIAEGWVADSAMPEVCVCVRERKRACVCVCERERERERERYASEIESVYMCVCGRERERLSVFV